MEPFHIAVLVFVGLFVLLVLIRLVLRTVDKHAIEYSESYRHNIEMIGANFHARYEQYMAEYRQHGNRLTYALDENFDDLFIEITHQITDINYNLLRLLSEDQKIVTSYRATWRQYEKKIGRLLGLKSK